MDSQNTTHINLLMTADIYEK